MNFVMYAKPPAKRCPKCGNGWMMVRGRHAPERSAHDPYNRTELVYYCPLCEETAELPVDYDPMNFDRRCQL